MEGEGKKKRKITSEVWAYFTVLTPKPNEELKCKCKKCKRIYSAESKKGTGNLLRHIKKCQKMTTKNIGQYLLTAD